MEIDAKNSKCWTCQFGMCISESETTKLLHEGVQEVNEQADIFAIEAEAPEPLETQLFEHTVEQTRVKAICFWKPDSNSSPPILVAEVHQCNRYEARKV